MKTLITFCFILVATVTMAQNTENNGKNSQSIAEKEQEDTSLKLLLKSLEQIGEEDILLSKDSLAHQKNKLSVLYKIQQDEDNFDRVLRRFKDSTNNTKISYHIRIKDTITLDNFKELQIPELENLKETLREFVSTLQNSSQLKELAAALKKLEQANIAKD